MSNYLSNIVHSNFGDKAVVYASMIMDDGAGGAAVKTGFNNLDYVACNCLTAGEYVPHLTLSGGEITVTTASSASSYTVMIVGR